MIKKIFFMTLNFINAKNDSLHIYGVGMIKKMFFNSEYLSCMLCYVVIPIEIYTNPILTVFSTALDVKFYENDVFDANKNKFCNLRVFYKDVEVMDNTDSISNFYFAINGTNVELNIIDQPKYNEEIGKYLFQNPDPYNSFDALRNEIKLRAIYIIKELNNIIIDISLCMYYENEEFKKKYYNIDYNFIGYTYYYIITDDLIVYSYDINNLFLE